MIRRTLHVVLIICCYISMHEIAYRFLMTIARGSEDLQFFTWWWSWFLAAPLTAIGIAIPIYIIGYIKGDL